MAVNSSSSSNGSTGSTGSKSTGSTGSRSTGSTGSKSTGSQASSKTSAGGATTSNSTGNFSGGRLPGLGGQSFSSWSGSGSETAAAHASGVQGPGLANGNFGSSWSGNGNHGSGSGNYTYNNTTYSNNKSEPVMTVDEVYGKTGNTIGISGNQSIVEKQGDYTASSNEKSDVDTSTFGKQDDITVTPESITENKGLVDNSAIDSIEGLNFQQKDKESQDVMEAKKSRDDAEAEDKADDMRNQLKAVAEKGAEETEDNNTFQIGEKNTFEEENNAKLTELNKLENDLNEVNKSLEESKNAKLEADKKVEQAEQKYQEALTGKKQVDNVTQGLISQMEQLNANPVTDLLSKTNVGSFKNLRSEVADLAEQYNIEVGDISKANVSELKTIGKKVADEVRAVYDQALKTAENELTIAQKQQKDLEANQNILMSKAKELESNYAKAQEDYKTFESEYWADDTATTAENVASDTKQVFDNAIQNAVEKGADEQTVQAMTDIATSIDEAQTLMKQAIAANDIPTYIEAQKTYNKYLNEAFKIGNGLTRTDYNKDFVTAVAKANDFEVTLADGTKTTYSQFATDMAVKSPEVAKAMYEAKAQKYEAENHPVLAKIERAKAEMVGTWLGSKLTQADNQVRNQFNQMAKTNMRATYAAYNNVLNDTNATPEQKADAEAQISQANSLMTASAALQASTGFLSGIGDSMKDGVYGTTDQTALNAYQETLNAVDNFVKITLGLGVTPGANKAYQNMYYMAGAKVNESGLFSKDFDSDGFALCQEYGNNAAAGMIAGAGELATGVALFFNPAMSGMALNLVVDSITTFTNGLYGVQKDAIKAEKYTQEVLNYFKEAQSIAAETGNKEALDTISNGITQIENFQLKSDEVGSLDNWLEGSGSNTATNEKFNQSLTYDEWLKLIEADPTMRDYAKKLIAEKKEK